MLSCLSEKQTIEYRNKSERQDRPCYTPPIIAQAIGNHIAPPKRAKGTSSKIVVKVVINNHKSIIWGNGSVQREKTTGAF